MSELLDRLERLDVEARSPDGGITGYARGKYQVELHFVGSAYHRYSDTELAHQLEQLASLLWTRYRREYLEILSLVTGDIDDLNDAVSPNEQAYRERLEGLTVTGVSAEGWISVRSRALVSWDITLTDGAVDTLSQERFLGEALSALAAVLADYQAKVIIMTDEIYGIGIPQSLRQAARDRGEETDA